jgi:hypothetical protein
VEALLAPPHHRLAADGDDSAADSDDEDPQTDPIRKATHAHSSIRFSKPQNTPNTRKRILPPVCHLSVCSVRSVVPRYCLQVPANRVELFSRVVVGLASNSATKIHRRTNAKNRMASPGHYLLKTTQHAVPLDADTYGSKTDFRECINDGFEFLAREKP